MTSLLTSCHIEHVCDIIKAAILDDLPRTTNNKAHNDLYKRLNVRILADGGHFEHITGM